MQRGGRGRGVAIVVATVVLVLAVAFASRPTTPLVTHGFSGGGVVVRVLFDVGVYLFFVYILVSLGILIWALWPTDRMRRPRPRPWWQQILSYAGLAVLIVGMMLVIRDPAAVRRLQNTPLARTLAELRATARAGHSSSSHAPGTDWAALLITALIVLAIAAVLLWQWWRWRRRRVTPQALALGLEDVLQEAITDLDPEPGGTEPVDPREAVIAAWTGLEAVLARNGLPVRPGEAPQEYLTRALAEASLPLAAEPLRRFTDLFEWARYSTNPVTERMREEAISTLTAVRDGLHHHAVTDLRVVPT